MLTYATLFSGVGGWDQGLEAAGFGKPLWMCEIGAFQRKVLAHRYPGVRVYEDVTRLHALHPLGPSGGEWLGDRLGGDAVARRIGNHERCPDCVTERPDILVASPPCQDLSVAGKRAGISGTRSGLFFDFVRLAGELRPSWILMEQVPGLLSSNGGRDFEVVIDALVECGYGLSWRTLDARFFVVPQRRRRVFLVGHLGGPCPAEILFESEGGVGDLAAGDEAGEGIAGEATGGLARSLRARPNASHREDSDTYIPEVAIGISASMSKYAGEVDASRGTLVAHTLRSSGFDASEDGTGRGTPIVTYALTKNYGKQPDNSDTNAGPDLIIAAPLTAGGHPNSNAPGRRGEDDVNIVTSGPKMFDASGHHRESLSTTTTPTLSGYEQPMLVSPSVRRLTPTECERLMGWPDGWTCLETWTADHLYSTDACKCSDGPRYAACGNGVVSDCAEWVGRQLIAAMTVPALDREGEVK